MRYLRLAVVAAVAVALTAAVGMSLVRSSGERAGDHSTTLAGETRETHGKATFVPTGAPRAPSAELSADARTDRELDVATQLVTPGAVDRDGTVVNSEPSGPISPQFSRERIDDNARVIKMAVPSRG